MRGVYSGTIVITGLNSARTLMYLTAPSTAVVEIISASVTNESNATNEQDEICFQRISALGTPTATSLTPSQMEPGDQASGSTVKGNVTASEPTYSSNTQIGREGFSTLGGWYFDPVPEERPIVPPSANLGLRCITNPTSYNADVRMNYREIG